jgi:hypothetical protein
MNLLTLESRAKRFFKVKILQFHWRQLQRMAILNEANRPLLVPLFNEVNRPLLVPLFKGDLGGSK